MTLTSVNEELHGAHGARRHCDVQTKFFNMLIYWFYDCSFKPSEHVPQWHRHVATVSLSRLRSLCSKQQEVTAGQGLVHLYLDFASGDEAQDDKDENRSEVQQHGDVEWQLRVGCVDGPEDEEEDGPRRENRRDEEKCLQHKTLYGWERKSVSACAVTYVLHESLRTDRWTSHVSMY